MSDSSSSIPSSNNRPEHSHDQHAITRSLDFLAIYDDFQASNLSLDRYITTKLSDFLIKQGYPEDYKPSMNTLRRRFVELAIRGEIPSTRSSLKVGDDVVIQSKRITKTMDFEAIFKDFTAWGKDNVELYHRTRLNSFLMSLGYPHGSVPCLPTLRIHINRFKQQEEMERLRQENSLLKAALAEKTSDAPSLTSPKEQSTLFAPRMKSFNQEANQSTNSAPPLGMFELFLNYEGNANEINANSSDGDFETETLQKGQALSSDGNDSSSPSSKRVTVTVSFSFIADDPTNEMAEVTAAIQQVLDSHVANHSNKTKE